MLFESNERFFQRSAQEKHLSYGLALCSAVYAFHYTWYSSWYIEDAAISFSFARNAASGEGFVAYPGGERVEGFSNASWTLLLTGLDAVGLNPFIAAKLLGLLLGVLTLSLVLRWTRRVLPEQSERYAVLAPFLLSLCPQFVMWNASGLENSLFNFLLAFAAVRLLDDVELKQLPLSGVLWGLLAITRPEAPLYAAIAGIFAVLTTAASGGFAKALRFVVGWVAGFLSVFGAWHLWRYWYFAWEFPNTYYGKLAEGDRFQPFGWKVRGWRYLRNYSLQSAQAFVLPLYVFGQTGFGRRGLRIGAAVCLVGGLLLLPGLGLVSRVFSWTEPGLLVNVRVLFLTACVALLPALGLRRHGGRARWLAASQAVVAVFFALYTGGDWMKGFRWLAMASVPLAVLFTDGLVGLAGALQRSPRRRLGRLTLGLVLAVPLVTGVIQSGRYIFLPETSPYDVRWRVAYMQGVQQRLGIERPTLLEVDMGAHMWWSGFGLVDMAGLVDVPMAHHKWEKPFVADYVYGDRAPDFAHVHGYWGRRTKMTRHPQWRQYVKIDPFPVSRWSQHTGNHIHKRWLLADGWEDTSRQVSFEGGLQFVGWRAPTAQLLAGSSFEMELVWSRGAYKKNFRALVFLKSGEQLLVVESAPGYDWYLPATWRRNEKVRSLVRVDIPPTFAAGEVDLGVLVLDEDLGTLVPQKVPVGIRQQDPVVARGEVRWPSALQVLSSEEAQKAAQQLLTEVGDLSAAMECSHAERLWRKIVLLSSSEEQKTERSTQRSQSLAVCYARLAERSLERDQALDEIVSTFTQARWWSHRHPLVRAVGRKLADRFEEQGDQALERGEVKQALQSYKYTLASDPSRSWVRRRLESTRDRWLDSKEGA